MNKTLCVRETDRLAENKGNDSLKKSSFGISCKDTI